MSSNKNSNKSIKSESPKTPGGISISLLTPCRRVGLSKNWRKKGPSPFISPLTNTQHNNDENQSTPQAKNLRKRKKSPEIDNQDIENEDSPLNLTENDNSQTPTRINVIRKRSKILLSKVTHGSICESPTDDNEYETKNDEEINNSKPKDQVNVVTKISRLSRNNSVVKSIKHKSPQKPSDADNKSKEIHLPPDKGDKIEQSNLSKTSNKSPQNLTTECVVVIQKEIFNCGSDARNESEIAPKPSQGLFDSDSDDIPLCQINKNNIKDTSDKTNVMKNAKYNINTKDHSATVSLNKAGKLEHKKTSTTDLKVMTKKLKVSKKTEVIKKESKPSSQSSFDDEDDDDFDHRRTIIVKKSYNKVSKPLKAKSTGSITEKDIEELRNRIEVKKKLLLAKSLGADTQDLRDLIKKWQKGCQEALVELMELMKKKMPDQPNVENAQILEMLKIPANLVGYDSENDCFISPNDTNIILSSLKI